MHLKNWKIHLAAIVLFALNVLLILQLIPVLESQTFGAKLVNFIVSPPNFLFEDLFGISGNRLFDVLTWTFQLAYDYLLVILARKIFLLFK